MRNNFDCVGRLVKLKLENRTVLTLRSFHQGDVVRRRFRCMSEEEIKSWRGAYGLVMSEYAWNNEMNARQGAETFVGVENADKLLYVVYFDNNLVDLWEDLDFEWV